MRDRINNICRDTSTFLMIEDMEDICDLHQYEPSWLLGFEVENEEQLLASHSASRKLFPWEFIKNACEVMNCTPNDLYGFKQK